MAVLGLVLVSGCGGVLGDVAAGREFSAQVACAGMGSFDTLENLTRIMRLDGAFPSDAAQGIIEGCQIAGHGIVGCVACATAMVEFVYGFDF